MSADKLPEWPKPPREKSSEFVYMRYWIEKHNAALARMGALVEVVTLWRKRMRHSIDEDDLQAVDELLAACERRREG